MARGGIGWYIRGMKFDESVFKAYDVRGAAPSAVSPDLAEAVGRALADWLPTDGAVAVGRDMRLESSELADRLILGLTMQGRDVLDIGLVTSDMIYFATGHYGLAGGAMVTASHNPGQDDGIKLCRDQAAPIGLQSGLEELKGAIACDRYTNSSQTGKLTPKDIKVDWIKHCLSFIDSHRLKAYKMAVDAGNGMAGVIIPELEPMVPLQITRMYFDLDGTFPNHPANPMQPENLKALSKMILAEGLDLGLAFDGDGDRAFLVDETGSAISGSVMTVLLIRHVLKKYPEATIVYDVRVSKIVPDTIKELGGVAVRAPVGHPNIVAAMQANGAVFGAEATGHFYFSDNFYADGALLAALMAIAVLSESDEPVSKQVATYKYYFSSDEINRTVEDLPALKEALEKHFGGGVVDHMDGLTIEFKDWWFNLRGSNTEPIARLNIEANSVEVLEQRTAELLSIVS